MRIILSFLAILFFCQTTIAQITIDMEHKDDGSIELYAINAEKVPYTVFIDVTEHTNLLPIGS